MSFFDKLKPNWFSKDNTGSVGDTKKEPKKQDDKINHLLRIVIFLAVAGLIVVFIPRTSFKITTNYTIGEPWKQDDLTAPFTFSLLKSEEELAKERESIRKRTPPIFHIDPKARIRTQTRIDSLFNNIDPVLKSYVRWQRNQKIKDSPAVEDSIRFVQEKNLSGVGLSNEAWQPLLENYAQIKLHDSLRADTGDAETPNRFIGVDIKLKLEHLINSLYNDGIINLSKNELNVDEITVRNLQQHNQRTVKLNSVRDIQEAQQEAKLRLQNTFLDEPAITAYQIYNLVIEPNYIFNAEETQNRIDESLASISPTKGVVAQGQVIIRRGDLITEEKMLMLESLARARSENASLFEVWVRYGGNVLLTLVILLVFFIYLAIHRPVIYDNISNYLLVFLVMGLIGTITSLSSNFEFISPYLIPIAIAPIILTIIYDAQLGLVATLSLALMAALINGNSYEFAVATTVGSSLGVFTVRDLKDRSRFFFYTPGMVFLAYGIVLVSFNLTKFGNWEDLGFNLLNIGGNAVFILFTYPLILILEKTFKITTDFTLLELGDTNMPLLKELMSKAPGTFHHSLSVSNMAETAANEIGANALLCRVAALYHDIGKMERPGYFIENQTASTNEHSKLKARMSALVIKAHVTKGVEMARKHRLPETIIDFIKTHHGTTLIRIFYDKAKKEAGNEHEIREEDFRYEGPIPFSKETAILHLADGVEASSRTMKEPTYQKLENLIDHIFEIRINDGQLNNAPLTFKDLKIIKQTFRQILIGSYHGRIDYPEEKKDEKKQGTKLKAAFAEEDTSEKDSTTEPEKPSSS